MKTRTNRIGPAPFLMVLLGVGFLAGCANSSKQSSLDDGSLSEQAIPLAFQVQKDFGKSLTAAEKAKLAAAEREALDFGTANMPVRWQGERSGVFGSVMPSAPFRVGSNNCRRFQHQLNSGSKVISAQGVACRRSNGSWRLVR